MLENSYLIQAWKYQNFSSKKGRAWPVLLFLNKASLLYECLGSKIFLWSRQGRMFKLVNPKHKHGTERQSLVNSLSLSCLVYWTKINNSHAKLMYFSLLVISSHIFSRLVKNCFIYTFSKYFCMHFVACIFN